MQEAIRGYCPICCRNTTFIANDDWFRDSLVCSSCEGGSVPRQRALALVLRELRPRWRRLAIHESSPSPGAMSSVMASTCKRYVPTHYFPHLKPGETGESGIRNENLERQTFADGTFDIVITQDVMEHVFDPASAYKEIYRTLKDGGVYIHTFPIRKWLASAVTPRASLDEGGNITHTAEPEYHGNPIDKKGALVTVDYGYDVHQWIAAQAPFDVRVYRFHDPSHGIIGEYTDTLACFKRGGADAAASSWLRRFFPDRPRLF